MSIPNLAIDDNVVFEIDPTGTKPRWVLNTDKGYTGIWAIGIITEINNTYIRVDALFPDGEVRAVSWPNYDSSDFETEQWLYPGYLQKIKEGSPLCECGCGNNDKNGHYDFCPRWEWFKNQDVV